MVEVFHATVAAQLEAVERLEAVEVRCAACLARRHLASAVVACRGGHEVVATYHVLQAMGVGLEERCGLPVALHEIVTGLLKRCIAAGTTVPLSEAELAALAVP